MTNSELRISSIERGLHELIEAHRLSLSVVALRSVAFILKLKPDGTVRVGLVNTEFEIQPLRSKNVTDGV